MLRLLPINATFDDGAVDADDGNDNGTASLTGETICSSKFAAVNGRGR